jgi:hypothetical protein
MFYVYIHRKGTNGDPFYVGKGKGNRAWTTRYRNPKWNAVFKKHGLVVEIIVDNLSEQDAFELERQTIAKLKLAYDLSNLTDGGEGFSGFKPTPEQCKAISMRQLGKPKPPSEQERLRKLQLGRKHSEATRQKVSIASSTRGNNDKRTYLFYTDSDIFIGTRKEFSAYSGICIRNIAPLFAAKRPYKSTHGWSLLRVNELLLLKELYANCN